MEPIALRATGDTMANIQLLDSMANYCYVLSDLAVDEVELALASAWLMFDWHDSWLYDEVMGLDNNGGKLSGSCNR